IAVAGTGRAPGRRAVHRAAQRPRGRPRGPGPGLGQPARRMAPRQSAAIGSHAHLAPDRIARLGQPGRAGRTEHLARAQGLPRRPAPGPDDCHRDPGRRDPQDRPRNPRPAARDLQRRQRPLRRAVPEAVRRRRGQADHDRRGNPRRRRAGH
ncbi:hypothetical protein OY671_012367, partial [Metschnikowia pulcherrima]